MSAHPKDNAGVSLEGQNEGSMTNRSEAVALMRPDAARVRRSGRTTVVALVALAMAGLVACEGDNAFSGEGASYQPRVLEIAAPEAVFAGDTVRIRVDAFAARQVAQVVLSIRGAAVADTVVKIDAATQQVSQIVDVALPAVFGDSLLTIQARITDAAGVQSGSREILVPAYGPPVVVSVSGPSGVRPGENIAVSVRAFGARGVSRLNIAARGAISTDTSIAITPAMNSVERNVAFSIPDVVGDTLITFNVTAEDELGLKSPATVGLVSFAIDAPSVQMIAPTTVEGGKVLNVAVLAHSLRQIKEVKLEVLSGVPQQSLVHPITPSRATVEEYFSFTLPANVDGPITIRAVALDRADARSETPVEMVTVPTDAPIVLAVDPTLVGFPLAGEYIDVRVEAFGHRPLKEVKVRWRGFDASALQEVENAPEQAFELTPPRSEVTEDFNVQTPCVAAGGTMYMLVTARDQDDRLSPIVISSVTVGPNPSCNPPEEVPEEEEEAPLVRPWRVGGVSGGR